MNVKIEKDSYALSPMQQGMLYHHLSSRESGVDVEQIFCKSLEKIEVSAFEKAWQEVVNRHPIFRTTFHWADQSSPRQKVWDKVIVDFSFENRSENSLISQDQAFSQILVDDRRCGFDLSAKPPIRIKLFHYPDGTSRFLWTLHHILLDGRGVVIVLNEVFSIYEANLQNGEYALPRPQEYRQYVDWLQQQEWSLAETFWRNALAGFRSATPISPHASGLQVFPAFGEQEIHISEADTALLKSLARRNNLTPNTILQAGWALLLSRYTREEDVVFGAIRACRRSNVPNSGSVVGLLINTVPVRIRVPQKMSALAWLKMVRETWSELRNFEHTSLADIQGWSEVPRGEALFETIFNYQDPSWDAALRAQGGKWTERTFGICSQSNYPLVVDAYGGSSIVIKLLYHRNRFEDAMITRMLGHFITLLKGLVTSANEPLGGLPILTEKERGLVMREWNGPKMKLPEGKCVHHLFEEQARRTPDAEAVADEDQSLSYAELNLRANSLAKELRTLGIKPENCVGICLKRSVAMAIAKIAVWKAGGAYLPLDSSCPAERLNFMINDAEVEVLLIESSQRSRFQAEVPNCTLLCVDTVSEITSASPVEKDEGDGEHFHGDLSGSTGLDSLSQSARSLAYIIYTSGSTGQPKGVQIEHLSLINLILWHQRSYQVAPSDRAAQTATPAFDACVWELWPYLTAGASVHFPDEVTRLSSEKLVHWLTEKAITLAFVSTPIAEKMLDEDWPDDCKLRALLTGGDKLRRPPGQKLPCMLVNHYGPTENTVVTTWTAVPPQAGYGPPAIGRPISNTDVYILDPNLQPVPVGVPGELFIGGVSLARGYHNRPELTAEKFILNPFSSGKETRLYKSGDLVRWMGNGQIEFLGRLDHQVKIRGQRIELGEIESVLMTNANIREAVVVAHQNAKGENWLAAYIIPTCGSNILKEELRLFLKQKLPDAMVPTAIVMMETFPLTANGKIDRHALPKPEVGANAGNQFIPPRTQTEKKIIAIWTEVIGVEHIGVNDNFFELGGHSLTATQVVSRLMEAFKIEIPLYHLFDAPTVGELGAIIDKLMDSGAKEQPISLEPALLTSAN